WAAASALTYAEREPPKLCAITAFSASSTAFVGTGVVLLSRSRSKSALYAVSRSPVTACSWSIWAFVRRRLPIRHCVPLDSTLSCPSVRDASKPETSCLGASHSDDDRVHSQTHAARPLSGSSSGAVYLPHPHDQSEAIPVSVATWRSASA